MLFPQHPNNSVIAKIFYKRNTLSFFYCTGKGVNIWDTFCHVGGNIENDDTGDVACDGYHKYEEDVQLIKQLGVCHKNQANVKNRRELRLFSMIDVHNKIFQLILRSRLAFLYVFNLLKQYFLPDIPLQIFYIVGETNAGRNKQ